MLSLLICRLFFGELSNSFVHFPIRSPSHCWVLSLYSWLRWAFREFPPLWKVSSVLCTVLSSTAIFKAILQPRPQIQATVSGSKAAISLFTFVYLLCTCPHIITGASARRGHVLASILPSAIWQKCLNSNCQPWHKLMALFDFWSYILDVMSQKPLPNTR